MSSTHSEKLDPGLWDLACHDDQSAFAELVRRHQSAVCAVAYNACGDLSLSEDVSQETFWVAWRDRASLLDPSRLRAWLCGIARNLARNSRRQSQKPAASLDDFAEPAGVIQEPSDQAVSREEETLVWEALEQIPETYREPLILYYRENQSMTEVATTLELSTDTVKQRLARGRNLLRDQVASKVEATLRRSAPRGRFTVTVMAGLTSVAAGSQTAAAGTGASMASTAGIAGGFAAAKTAGTVAATGMLGGLLGVAGGLFGGWVGTWVPAQLAPTNRERKLHLAVGRRMLIASAILSLLLLVLLLIFASSASVWMIVGISTTWICLLNIYIATEVVLLIRAIQKIRQETPAESDPNNSWLKSVVERRVVNQCEGRVWRSSATLFGLPLVDIQVSTPSLNSPPPPPKKARGWIAIGDRADGILLAIGGVARGGIACGGMSIGLVSLGGVSLGIFSIGGLALGAIAVGGLAIGGIAFGGGAIGWQAAGGGAIAWDVACGGGAIAYHAAKGGAAIAHDYAIGGSASAMHANDAAAQAVLEAHWLVRSMEWYIKNSGWTQIVLVAACVLPAIAIQPLMYRKRRVEE